MNFGMLALGNRWEAVGLKPVLWKDLQLNRYRSPFLKWFLTGGHFAPAPNLQSIFGKEGRKTFLVVITGACSVIWWVELRDAINHLTMHRSPQQRIIWLEIPSAQAETACLIERKHRRPPLK